MSDDSSSNQPVEPTPRKQQTVRGLITSLAALWAPAYLLEPFVPYVLVPLPASTNVKNALYQLLIKLISVAFIAMYVRISSYAWSDFGVGKIKSWFAAQAIVAFGVYFMLSMALVLVTSQIIPIDHTQPQELGYILPHGGELVLVFVVLALIVPFAEELLFRGLLYGSLRNRFSAVTTSILVSVIFAFVHGQWNVAIDVFALSLVICYLREQSNSIWPGVFLHMLKNGVAFTLLYIYNGG